MSYLELSKCLECPFNNRRKVLGKGLSSPPYEVVIVGIHPSTEEARKNEPMVGWSGSLLRKVLGQLDLDKVYLTNSILCEAFSEDSQSNKEKAASFCKERLLEEIRELKPRLIVALGNIPLYSLTDTNYKITEVQGEVLPGLVGPTLAIQHPVTLLSSPEGFPDFIDMVKIIPSYLSGTFYKVGEVETVVMNSENRGSILQLLDNAVEAGEEITIDLETTGRGFYPYGRDPDKIRCIMLAVDNHTAYVIPGESSPYFDKHPNYVLDDELRSILNRAKCNFHNGCFDTSFLRQVGYDVKINFDTFLGHYTLDERTYSHGLKTLSRKYLGTPDWEAELDKYLPNKSSSYDLVPDDDLYKYASYDVICTRLLTDMFRPKVLKFPFYNRILIPAANMFTDLRHRGIRIDMDVLFNLDEYIGRAVDEAQEVLDNIVGYSLNVGSSQEVGEYIYDKLKLEPTLLFGRSTSEKALKQYSGVPAVEAIVEVRQLRKMQSTYVWGLAPLLDNNYRIHPFTKLTGAVTGRLSTTDPSVYNIAENRGKDIKKLYIPEEGHLVGDFDQKQMELRCFCIVGKDEHLRDMLIKGVDPHAIVTEAIYGKEFIKDDQKRQRAKSGVFGRMYLRGKQSFMNSFGMSSEEVDKLLETVDSFFPKAKQYASDTKEEIHKKGYLESYFGRRRRFSLITDRNREECYRQGVNFRIQSMGSDVNLLCMLHLYDLRNETGAWPLFPVHDSIVMDIPDESSIPILKKEIEEYAKQVVNDEMEFTIDVEAGKSWGDTSPFCFKCGHLMEKIGETDKKIPIHKCNTCGKVK